MLAQNFKTAAELGLDQPSYDAHVKVLHALERGEMIHTKIERHYDGTYLIEPQVPNGFNMGPRSYVCNSGTCRCILGWADVYTEGGKVNLSTKPMTPSQADAYARLVNPNNANDRTVDEAAHALRTYLVTGEAEWA